MVQRFVQGLKKNLRPQAAVLLLLVVLVVVILSWGSWQPDQEKFDTAQGTATLSVEDATPLPLEWQENRHQTTGIVFGGILLVLIIVGGTLGAILRKGIPGSDH